MQQHEALTDLFVDTLKDIYSAEKQILRSLPKLARAADSDALREAFRTHRDQTEDQIERLDRVFEILGERAGRKTCEAMQGILEEGEEAIEEFRGSEALDAGLVASAQTVEHYEINRYSALIDWAEALNLDEAVSLLGESLSEEKETDRLLTEIAQSANAAANVGGAASNGAAGIKAKPAATASSRQGTASKRAQSYAAGAKTGNDDARNRGTASSSGTKKDVSMGGPAQQASRPTSQRETLSSIRPGGADVPQATNLMSGGSQKSPGTMGGRTAGDDDTDA